MTELGASAELAAAVRIRRSQLHLTRADVAAAGGPPPATQRAIESGRFTPETHMLNAIDTALQWPPGTAHTALTDQSRREQPTTPATLEQHRHLYRELIKLGASRSAIDTAGEILEQPLRLAIRRAVATTDLATLLAIDELLNHRVPLRAEQSIPRAQRPRSKRRKRCAAPEISTPTGYSTLRDIRLNHGMSLSDVCAKMTAMRSANGNRCPVSPGTISAIETGTRGMGPSMAELLEQTYRLPQGALSGYVRRVS